MEYNEIIDNLLRELGFRCDQGIVDLENGDHISILSEILEEMNLGNIKSELITNLLEGESFRNPVLNKKIKYRDKNGEEKEALVGNLLRLKQDDPGRIAAEKHLPTDPEERKAAMSDLGSENQPGRKDEPDPKTKPADDTEISEPAMGTVFQGQSGKDYVDSLPDGDPAKPKEKEKESSDSMKPAKPENGKLSDIEDPFSDGKIKQKGLTTGHREIRGFKPAPGNAGSMMAEIMSGEAYFHLKENPKLSVDDLAIRLYDQVKDTRLGKQNGDHTKSTNKSGLYAGRNQQLVQKMEAIASSGKRKWERTNDGMEKLSDMGIFTPEAAVTRNFYGHQKSIQQQVKLIKELKGVVYTRTGTTIPEDEIIKLIRASGSGKNPSDTSTITVDKDGNAMVEFHSDKLSTADIQANSTPNKESENAKELIASLKDVSGVIKEQSLSVIKEGQEQLKSKEEELKSAGSAPARIIKDDDMKNVMKKIMRGKNSKMMKSILSNVLYKNKQPHPFLTDYLPPDVEFNDTPTKEELLKAYLDSYSDTTNEIKPTGVQIQFMNYLGMRYGIDISENLSNIRMDSIEIQRDTLRKLNERSITLPNGEIKPVGDYIEARNIIDKLHLDVVDGDTSEGIGRYDGLFNLNMGGVIVESKQLKHCLSIDDTDDFIHNFEVGSPKGGETITKNASTGTVTGRNVFIYAVTKKGKRIPFGFKTSRSKQGQTGTLNTTYQYHPSIQNCFKKNQ